MNTINITIDHQLAVMEYCLKTIGNTIGTAREDIQSGNRNAAIGGLFRNSEAFATLKTLQDAILTMHRNADVIENTDDKGE